MIIGLCFKLTTPDAEVKVGLSPGLRPERGGHMPEYELIFEVDEPTEEQVNRLYDTVDAIFARHGRTNLVTITSDGASALPAALRATEQLESLGFSVHRLYEDFVTRSEIAERAGVTPQAVGLWIRGERVTDTENQFPEPYNYAARSQTFWLWSDVNIWLRSIAKNDDMCHPSRIDYVLVNSWLCSRVSSPEFTHYDKVNPVFVSTTVGYPRVGPMSNFATVTMRPAS